MLTSDSLFIVSGNFDNADAQGTSLITIKIDNKGEVIWRRIDDGSDVSSNGGYIAKSLLEDGDGNYLLGYQYDNDVYDRRGFDFRCGVRALSRGGQERRNYLSPKEEGIIDGANDMIALSDGSVIVASGVGYERPINQSNGYVVYEKMVQRMDSAGDVIWREVFHESDTLSQESFTTNLIDLPDEEAFILVGGAIHDLPDSLTIPGLSTQSVGWFAKMTYEGEIIWIRKHAYDWGTTYYHNVLDAEPTPDGGFIVVGMCGSQQAYPQQAWLLKLDADGCLVPGCENYVSIDEVSGGEVIKVLQVYPNPVDDWLYFTCPLGGVDVLQYRLTTMSGQTVSQGWVHEPEHTTMMLDLSTNSTGTYLLEVRSGDGRFVQAEKIIKQ